MAEENIEKTKNENISTDSPNEEKKTASEKLNQTKSKAKKATRNFMKKQPKVKELENEIKEQKTQLAELNDKYLRLFSEFDNYRKRTSKERLELSDMITGNVITDLLPVIDDFERAAKAIKPKDNDQKSALEGFTLIFNKLNGILTKKGLEPMKSIGQPFDTDFHEALTNIPAPSEEMRGKVVDEIEKGYTFKGKVIRFAKVVVGQ
jgi:molecular chaperone GrpE